MSTNIEICGYCGQYFCCDCSLADENYKYCSTRCEDDANEEEELDNE